MSNYTKTTNFASKDSLPSGNANKIVKGTEIDTEFNNIATAVATKADTAGPTFTGTVTIPTADINGGAVDGTTIGASSASSIVGTTIVANTSINIAGDGATVTGIKDEDDMSSNSATKLATQQSIKAYVDSQVTAQDLDVTDGSSSIDIDLDSESLGILGGTGIDSTASGTGVTLAIDSTVATLTGSQTLTNKTLTAPTLTGTAVVASLDISGDVDVDGTLETDALSINGTTVTSTAAELNILDGVTSTTAELNILDGVTSTTAELNILDGVTATASELNIMDGVTASTAELNIMDGVTSTTAELNILDGKAFLDEDDMSSNSATGIASQQSIKAYVDAQITAEDLDFQADSGGALSIDLDSETLTFTGGTGIDTSGSGNAVTFAIDSTVATLTGSQTLTNKTLTSPDINTPDIDGGAIDGTTIGGSTPAAGTFTSVSVDNITIDGTEIDLSSGDLTLDVAGNILLNADGGGIYFQDAGVLVGSFQNSSSDFLISAEVADKDIIFRGIDSSTTIDALKLDMENGGNATFSGSVTATSVASDTITNASGNLNITSTGSILLKFDSDNNQTNREFNLQHDSGTSVIKATEAGDISFYDGSGNAAVHFDSSAAALGINNTSPSSTYSIDAGKPIRSSGSAPSFTLQETDASNQTWLMASYGGVFAIRDTTVSGSSYPVQIDAATPTNTFRLSSAGNVGIGTSSPRRQIHLHNSSSATTKLMITNGATGESNDSQGFQIGIDGSGNAIVENRENTNLTFYTNNNPRITVLAGGNVGIGTGTNVDELLHIEKSSGTTLVKTEVASGSTVGFEIKKTGSTTSNWRIVDGQTVNGNLEIYDVTNSRGVMTFDQSGDVTANPSGGVITLGANGHITSKQSLDVVTAGGRYMGSSNRGLLGQLRIEQTAQGADGGYVALDTCAVGSTSPTERMRIDSSGTLAVGTTDTHQWTVFDGRIRVGATACFASTSNSVQMMSNAYYDNNYRYIANDEASRYYQSSGGHHWDTAASGSADGVISFSEAMRITSGGNVAINTPTPVSGSMLSVLVPLSQTSNAFVCKPDTNGTTNAAVFVNSSGANAGYIQYTATTTTYATSSDYRMKENVVGLSGATDRLKQLNPSRFNFIADADTTVDGFLAHEVQAVVPEAVTGTKDAVDADGNPEYQGIDQSKLVPLLVATIQELEARITQLENN